MEKKKMPIGKRFKKGHIPWIKGKHWDKKYKEKMSQKFKGKILRKTPYFRGEEHPSWKGGKFKDEDGYIMVLNPHYPKESKRRYIEEHRLVMEKHLNRKLESWEQIHHKNGIKNDNKLKNLELVISQKHFGQMRCPYCSKEFLIK